MFLKRSQTGAILEKYIVVILAIYILNIPFGVWRTYTTKFSVKWFLAIHAPIPVIFWIRYHFDVHHSLTVTPLLVLAFFLGQVTGRLFSARFLRSSMQ